MNSETKTMTTKEAAKSLQVDESTVRKWLRRGKLEGQKVDGAWQVLYEDKNCINCQDNSPAFLNDDDNEITLGDVYFQLSKMWKRTDVLPPETGKKYADVIEEATGPSLFWSEGKRESVQRLRQGCTYAEAAWILKSELDGALAKRLNIC